MGSKRRSRIGAAATGLALIMAGAMTAIAFVVFILWAIFT